eukprot:TRINITY_DN228_c1_g2_i1.p2 TRINITY_DN228_c1_g2~~TRINITY_DN228_c1_g2_i1.p2  ORF type:complete len:101 (-),score=3.12 TRINITY_DN228_c1_g2_i1:95-397(-)
MTVTYSVVHYVIRTGIYSCTELYTYVRTSKYVLQENLYFRGLSIHHFAPQKKSMRHVDVRNEHSMSSSTGCTHFPVGNARVHVGEALCLPEHCDALYTNT